MKSSSNISYKVTRKTHIVCFLFSALISLMLFNSLNNVIDSALCDKLMQLPTSYAEINFYGFMILLLAPISFFHELIHGMFFKLFRGKVKYGFKGIYAYTMETSGMPLERDKFLIVLLAPLVIISLVSLLSANWIFQLIFFLNLLGSTGDLYMALLISRYDQDACIIDREYGFDVI